MNILTGQTLLTQKEIGNNSGLCNDLKIALERADILKDLEQSND